MNRELSLANAIAHGEEVGIRIFWKCENCGYDHFSLEHYRENFSQKIGNRHEDIIMERKFYLKCLRCGSEEANHILTIVPSWSAPNIDRDKLPVWEES